MHTRRLSSWVPIAVYELGVWFDTIVITYRYILQSYVCTTVTDQIAIIIIMPIIVSCNIAVNKRDCSSKFRSSFVEQFRIHMELGAYIVGSGTNGYLLLY